MGHVENLDDYSITLNLDQTLNQKTYNTPLTSEVVVVWIEGSERIDLDELDATSAELKATYQEIKDYVLKESGLKVSSLRCV